MPAYFLSQRPPSLSQAVTQPSSHAASIIQYQAEMQEGLAQTQQQHLQSVQDSMFLTLGTLQAPIEIAEYKRKMAGLAEKIEDLRSHARYKEMLRREKDLFLLLQQTVSVKERMQEDYNKKVLQKQELEEKVGEMKKRIQGVRQNREKKQQIQGLETELKDLNEQYEFLVREAYIYDEQGKSTGQPKDLAILQRVLDDLGSKEQKIKKEIELIRQRVQEVGHALEEEKERWEFLLKEREQKEGLLQKMNAEKRREEIRMEQLTAQSDLKRSSRRLFESEADHSSGDSSSAPNEQQKVAGPGLGKEQKWDPKYLKWSTAFLSMWSLVLGYLILSQ